MMLAARCGCPDVDRVADSLTKEQCDEWIVFGILDGWFDRVWQNTDKQSTKRTPQQMKEYLGQKYNS